MVEYALTKPSSLASLKSIAGTLILSRFFMYFSNGSVVGRTSAAVATVNRGGDLFSAGCCGSDGYESFFLCRPQASKREQGFVC